MYDSHDQLTVPPHASSLSTTLGYDGPSHRGTRQDVTCVFELQSRSEDRREVQRKTPLPPPNRGGRLAKPRDVAGRRSNVCTEAVLSLCRLSFMSSSGSIR